MPGRNAERVVTRRRIPAPRAGNGIDHEALRARFNLTRSEAVVAALLADACSVAETARRRTVQKAYNEEHGITPESIRKNIGEILSSVYEKDYVSVGELGEEAGALRFRTVEDIDKEIRVLEKQMREAAKALEFEKAAELRDKLKSLRSREFGLK